MTDSRATKRRRSEQIKRQTVDIWIDGALHGIRRRGKDPEDYQRPLMIHSHLDLIVLSGQYNYRDLRQKLGLLKLDKEFVPSERSPNYEKKLVRNFPKGIYLNVFVNPVKNYLPYCRLEIHKKHNLGIKANKDFIKILAGYFPRLNVSVIEYANDIYCWDSKAAMDLFDAIDRHLYVPYLRKMPELNREQEKEETKNSHELKMNRFRHIGSEKIYERGKNQGRQGKSWPIEYLDRVRLEHSADRRQLTYRGIYKIGDLLENPKFFEVNRRAYCFVNFEKSRVLPKYYDTYNSDPMYQNSFQAELLFHRRTERVKNIAQCISDTPHFAELISTMFRCWVRFDRQWKVST